jgi:hypothetical protein
MLPLSAAAAYGKNISVSGPQLFLGFSTGSGDLIRSFPSVRLHGAAEFISVHCLAGTQGEVFCGNSNLLDAGGSEWRVIIDHVISEFLRNGRVHFTQRKR